MCLALVLFVPSVASAQKNQQPPPPASTITLQIPGLNCTTPAGGSTFKVQSWTWGASNSGTLTGSTGSPGQTNLQDLSVEKVFDGCSAAVLSAITTGAVLKGATLTQVGADVSRTTTVELEGVLLTSWSVGSTTIQEAPSENLTLNFIKICMRDTASGTSACYDASTATQP
ncbi:type VI secretion system tube protein Hcp [Luteitalea sp.]